MTTVIATAVVPTMIAQRWFALTVAGDAPEEPAAEILTPAAVPADE